MHPEHQTTERLRIGLSISSYFDPGDRDAVRNELAASYEVYEVSLQRGGFPIPIEIFFEIPWDQVAAAGAVLGQLTTAIKRLLARFRDKRATAPDSEWSSVPAISIRAIRGDQMVEAVIHTADDATAETGLAALKASLDATFSQSTGGSCTHLHFDDETSKWEQ